MQPQMQCLAQRLAGKVSPLLFGLSTPYAAFKNAVANIGGLSAQQHTQFQEYAKCLLASQRHKIDVAALEDDFFRPSKLSPIPESFPYLNVLPHRHPELIFDRHFADSLSIIPTLVKITTADDAGADDTGKVSLVDIGSGGGLPGLAIAIVRPHWAVTVVDTVEKKCAFMSAVVKHLGLTNVTVLNARAEALCYYVESEAERAAAGKAGGKLALHIQTARAAGVPYLRESFDIALTRGVAGLDVCAEFSLPFLKVGGAMVALKTRNLSGDQVASKAQAPADDDAAFAEWAAPLLASKRVAVREADVAAVARLPWKARPSSLPVVAPLFAAEAAAASELIATLGGGAVKYVYLEPCCENNAVTGKSIGVLTDKAAAKAAEGWTPATGFESRGKNTGGAEGDDDDGGAAGKDSNKGDGRANVGGLNATADPDLLLMHFLAVVRKEEPTPKSFPRSAVKHKSKAAVDAVMRAEQAVARAEAIAKSKAEKAAEREAKIASGEIVRPPRPEFLRKDKEKKDKGPNTYVHKPAYFKALREQNKKEGGTNNASAMRLSLMASGKFKAPKKDKKDGDNSKEGGKEGGYKKDKKDGEQGQTKRPARDME